MDSIDEEEWREQGERHGSELTVGLVEEVCGGVPIEHVDEIELLFQPICSIPSCTLTALSTLTSLTLIRTGLARLPDLSPVKGTLRILHLASQGISSIANMPETMPSLELLILNDNMIPKIEGLDGCFALRKLWLQSNRIESASGLEHLGMLRELRLDDNNISSLEPLRPLINLGTLGLSANPLCSVECLEPLKALPALVAASFADDHYSCPCPFAENDGVDDYRLETCYHLKNLDLLDGVETGADRDRAEGYALKAVLDFADEMAATKRQHAADMADISRRAAQVRQAALEVEERLKGEVRALAASILPGREAVTRACEVERLRRQELRRAMVLELEALEREHAAECDRLAAEVVETSKADCGLLKSRIKDEEAAERDAASLSEMASGLVGGQQVVCHPVEVGSKEHTMIKRLIERGDGSPVFRTKGNAAAAAAAERPRVFEVHRIIVRAREARFAELQAQEMQEAEQMFMAIGEEEAVGDVVRGMFEDGADATRLLRLECEAPKGVAGLLVCRVLLGRQLDRPVELEEATVALERGGVDSCVIQGGGVALVDSSRIRVDFHVRLSVGAPHGWDVGSLAKLLMPPRQIGHVGKLFEIEWRIESVVDSYRERVRESLGIRPKKERERAEKEAASFVKDGEELKQLLAAEVAKQDKLIDEIRVAKHALARTAKSAAGNTAQDLSSASNAGNAGGVLLHTGAPFPPLAPSAAAAASAYLSPAQKYKGQIGLAGSRNVYAVAAAAATSHKIAGGSRRVRPHSAVAALRNKMS